MLIALCLVLAVAVVALAVINVKVRARLDDSVALEAQRARELESAQEELRTLASTGEDVARERDEALERVQRARRDAAEVANRLTEATDRVDELEAANRELIAAEVELAARIHELDAQAAATPDEAATPERSTTTVPVAAPTFDGELMWALTLARIDRRWRVSVASGVETESPLMSSTSLLNDAIAIEVAAAREEAGALIDFTFDGDGDIHDAEAATVVTLVEELVAGVVKVADDAELRVAVDDDAVTVSVSASSDGVAVAIPGPAALLDANGRYRIERTRRTADAS